jgi:tryptophanyl-tRNA synthetase
LSYRVVKQAIYDHFMETFGPARERRKELEGQPDYVEEVMRRGAEKARTVTLPLVRQVRDAVGIPNP